jgi:hypothetical protein
MPNGCYLAIRGFGANRIPTVIECPFTGKKFLDKYIYNVSSFEESLELCGGFAP